MDYGSVEREFYVRYQIILDPQLNNYHKHEREKHIAEFGNVLGIIFYDIFENNREDLMEEFCKWAKNTMKK